jgi:hypothetical protein
MYEKMKRKGIALFFFLHGAQRWLRMNEATDEQKEAGLHTIASLPTMFPILRWYGPIPSKRVCVCVCARVCEKCFALKNMYRAVQGIVTN